MKNFFRLSMLLLVTASLVFVSCDKTEDEDPIVENKNFETLKTYLIDNNLDIDKMMTSWVFTAEAVYNANNDTITTNDFYIIDLRSAADFTSGHIAGSVNSTTTDIVAKAANAGGKKIAVVCYTGQTAAYGAAILRLSGYPTTGIMKWGMSGWNSTKDSWTANVGNLTTAANWTAAPGAPATLVNFGDPTLTSTKTTGAELLTERVAKLITDGYTPMKLTNTTVLGTPANYFVLNYWTNDIMIKYGHIVGAYRVNPLTLAGGEYKNLPTDNKPIAVYCWTGQTSTYLATYLCVLGYNAKTIMFGANGMIHSNLLENKWDVASQAKNYPLATK